MTVAAIEQILADQTIIETLIRSWKTYYSSANRREEPGRGAILKYYF